MLVTTIPVTDIHIGIMCVSYHGFFSLHLIYLFTIEDPHTKFLEFRKCGGHFKLSHSRGDSHGTSHCLESKYRDGVQHISPMCVVNCTIHMMICDTNMVYKEFSHHFFNVEVGFEGLWLKRLLIVSLIKVSGIEAHYNTYEKINRTLKICHKGLHSLFSPLVVTRDHPCSNGIIVLHILNQHLKLNCNN